MRTCRKTRETNNGSWLERATSLIDRVLTKSADNYEALRLRIEVAMSHHRFPRVIEYAVKIWRPGTRVMQACSGYSAMR